MKQIFKRRFKTRVVYYNKGYYYFQYSNGVFDNWKTLYNWSIVFEEYSLFIFELNTAGYEHALSMKTMVDIKSFIDCQKERETNYWLEKKPFEVKTLIK